MFKHQPSAPDVHRWSSTRAALLPVAILNWAQGYKSHLSVTVLGDVSLEVSRLCETRQYVYGNLLVYPACVIVLCPRTHKQI